MLSLRAHFDGRVIIPDEPLNLPAGCKLEIEVREIKDLPHAEIKFDKDTGLAYFKSPPGTPPITPEDVRRAMDDEDAHLYQFFIRKNKISGLPEFDTPPDAPPTNPENVRKALNEE